MKRTVIVILLILSCLSLLVVGQQAFLSFQAESVIHSAKEQAVTDWQTVTVREIKQHYYISPVDQETSFGQQMASAVAVYEDKHALAAGDFAVVRPLVAETGLNGVRQVELHYSSYHKGLWSVKPVDDTVLYRYHIDKDYQAFALHQLVPDQERLVEEITNTLADQAVSDSDAIVEDMVKATAEQAIKVGQVSLDRVTYQKDSLLLTSPLLGTPVKVPYASLFDVIDSDYLTGKSKKAYDTYLAEKEAEEAARKAEEEAIRRTNLFNNGPVLAGERVVALTFDDGPDRRTTPQVLDILARYNAKATFFLIGSNIAGNEDLLQRALAEGHELGNHTWNHPKLTALSTDQVAWQLAATTEAIVAATGVPPKTFRPPYGATNYLVTGSTELYQMLWTVDTLDWQNHSTAGIMANIEANLHPGAVILMHDIHQTTVDALPTVMDYLVSQGYGFVTISELYGLD